MVDARRQSRARDSDNGVDRMNSRRKGKTGELALVRKLKEYGFDVRRSQQYCGINDDADIVGIEGLHIECKYTAQGHGSTYDWIDQAKRDTKEDIPVVMHKKVSKEYRGNEWLVTLTLEDFMSIYSEVWTKSDKEGANISV